MSDNPLLRDAPFPPFDAIRPEHAEPAVDRIVAENRRRIAEIAASAPSTWEGLVAPLEALEERLERTWSPVAHLNAVMNSEAWREAYNRCLPKLTDYATELGQNEALYRAFRALREGGEYERLEPAGRRLVDNALRDFRLSGVELPAMERKRFRAIQEELARLGTRFEENLLDATQAWKREVTAEELAGLPETALALTRQYAEREGVSGHLLTLEIPCYLAVMSHARSRALRREVYEAYVTRASDRGPQAGRFDNGPVMERILALRHEAARLLGFSSYAELSLATKMASSVEEVLSFLRELARHSRSAARRELEELAAFARERDGLDRLEAWDVSYYAERMREERLGIAEEALRPYFPLPRVLEGMFEVVRRLFGVTVRPRDGVPVWHPDVRFYELADEDGTVLGGFWLDPYARPHKRGGAWMDECRARFRREGRLQMPLAFLTCNFTPPVGDDPALLTHDEVLTLFHEFGHGLHHLLTRIDWPSVGGIRGVPWDAVELPSQFLEYWCWEEEALALISGHHRTGEPLPRELLERLRAARNFHAGMQMVRQLEFALFDMRLHAEYEPRHGGRMYQILEEVRAEVAVVRPPEFNRFAHGFSHIFAGGYSAGYYSYKWAEVLAADAYSAFEEAGVFDAATGRRFRRAILEQGGAREPMELFVAFRGRPPRVEPLLRMSGIEPVLEQPR